MHKVALTAALASLVTLSSAQAEGTHDWSGVYGGIYAGSTNSKTDWTGLDDNATNVTTIIDTSYSGSTADLGGFLGLNFQKDQLLIGVEASYGNLDYDGSVTFEPLDGSEGLDLITQIDSIGSVRARLGYTVGESLFYATGGFAMSKSTQTWDDGGIGPPFDIDPFDMELDTGWVAGGGMEYAVTERLSVRAEALYYDFGSKSGTAPNGDETDTFEVKQTATSALVGVAYHF